jgi:hypothetical protein
MIYNRIGLLYALLLAGSMLSVSCRAQQTTNVPPASGLTQQTNSVDAAAAKAAAEAQKIRHIGDPAPPLLVMGWAKGKPVRLQAGTNFYAVVFCSLSRANDFALTNLSSLQKQYQDKGLITIAVSDEDPRILESFIKEKNDEIDFSVAADDLGSRTTRTFQHAFGQFQLPRAYIVGRDGNVLWFGHPLTDNMGQVVDEIAAGRYNLKREQQRVLAKQQMQQYLDLARDGNTNSAAAGRWLLGIRAHDPVALCDMAYQIATDPYLENRDAALANAALDRALEIGATNVIDIEVDRAIVLFQTGQEEAGLAKARQALNDAKSQEDKNEAEQCVHAMQLRMARKNAAGASAAGH